MTNIRRMQLAAAGASTSDWDVSGSLWGCGANSGDDAGMIGDNTETDRSSPVQVKTGVTNWVKVQAGYEHVIGLTANGDLYAWGSHANGRSTHSDRRSSPMLISGAVGSGGWSVFSTNKNSFFSIFKKHFFAAKKVKK